VPFAIVIAQAKKIAKEYIYTNQSEFVKPQFFSGRTVIVMEAYLYTAIKGMISKYTKNYMYTVYHGKLGGERDGLVTFSSPQPLIYTVFCGRSHIALAD
jgi:hypothetical protein